MAHSLIQYMLLCKAGNVPNVGLSVVAHDTVQAEENRPSVAEDDTDRQHQTKQAEGAFLKGFAGICFEQYLIALCQHLDARGEKLEKSFD